MKAISEHSWERHYDPESLAGIFRDKNLAFLSVNNFWTQKQESSSFFILDLTLPLWINRTS